MKKRTGKETSKKSFGAFEILSCIAIVALMIISVNCYIKKYEINYRTEVLEKEYDKRITRAKDLKSNIRNAPITTAFQSMRRPFSE